MSAAPYPFVWTETTRAPAALAIAQESSVEPLSATMTSPEMPRARIPRNAFSMQI